MSEQEDYKHRITGVFSRASATYDHSGPAFFSHWGRRLVEFAAIPPGSRVLDVACGRGAVFVPAAAAVGEAGAVTAIDLAEGMVEQARQEVAGRGLGNVTVLRMDAENLDFPDASFDFVLCGLCLFFLPNLDGALAGFRRVLKPGGRLVASTFEDYEDATTQRWDDFIKPFRARLKPLPQRKTQSLNTPEKIREVFGAAGFGAAGSGAIEVRPEQATFYFKDPEALFEAGWSHGGREFCERMDPDLLAEYHDKLVEFLTGEMTPQGIPDDWRLLLSQGQKMG